MFLNDNIIKISDKFVEMDKIYKVVRERKLTVK